MNNLKHSEMRNTLFSLLDAVGLGTVLTSGYMHLSELLTSLNYNKIVLVATSIVSLVFLVLKCQHQLLVNRQLKREGKKKTKKK